MTATPTEADRALLERAADLARLGWGRVHPNPMVGCVLTRGGRVIGEAYHREFGGPHAEILALENAGDARGATAYVSLEPCSHQGKTPPCTGALARAGVRRVVFGASDPTEAGRGGAAALRAEGIDVVGPLFDSVRAERENPSFHHAASHATPWVALKLAVSLDGRIAEAPGVRTHLTGAEANREVHRLRAGFDAILVGSRTARLDDPRLTVREDVPIRKPPIRVVLDSGATLSPAAALMEDISRAPVLVVVREDAPDEGCTDLEHAGATIVRVPPGPAGRGLDLVSALRACRDRGILSILCEGGGSLGASLVSGGLVGRIYLFVTPRILGPMGVPAFEDTVEPWGSGWVVSFAPASFGRDHLLVYDRTAEPSVEDRIVPAGG